MTTEMNREFKPWMDRPLPDISERDVRDLINRIKVRGPKGSKGQARAIFLLTRAVMRPTIPQQRSKVTASASLVAAAISFPSISRGREA